MKGWYSCYFFSQYLVPSMRKWCPYLLNIIWNFEKSVQCQYSQSLNMSSEEQKEQSLWFEISGTTFHGGVFTCKVKDACDTTDCYVEIRKYVTCI